MLVGVIWRSHDDLTLKISHVSTIKLREMLWGDRNGISGTTYHLQHLLIFDVLLMPPLVSKPPWSYNTTYCRSPPSTMARWILISLLIHHSFPPSAIVSMLYLLKRGLEREKEQLLGPRAAAVIGGIGRWLATTMALLETGNTWPGDGDVRA